VGSASLNLLLDTHVWLWALGQPDRIAAAARRAIDDGANPLWLSPISVWEAMLLSERGRIDTGPNLSGWLNEALAAMPMRDAPLTREVALASRTVPLSHEDPADRFIAASAIVHGLTLVTADARLLVADAYEVLSAA
jgi:PIN domain nuclease of toxin-antitoxin system